MKEIEKKDEKKILSFILAFLYIFLFLIIYIILNSLFQSISPLISEILSSLTIIIGYIILKRDELKEDFKNIKNTHYKSNIILFLIVFAITEICTLIFPKIFNIMITNQNNIVNNLETMPVITFIKSCLLAPIYEEILFRKNFKNSFNNKWLFIIVTSLLFASLHCLTIKSMIELVYFPLYFLLGGFLGYIYYNDNNILTSIKYHMLNNILAFIIQLFI